MGKRRKPEPEEPEEAPTITEEASILDPVEPPTPVESAHNEVLKHELIELLKELPALNEIHNNPWKQLEWNQKAWRLVS